MKKILIFSCAIFMCTGAFAQRYGKQDSLRRGDLQTDKLKTELSLNDNQYATLKSINKKYADKQHALREKEKKAHAESRAAMKSMRTEREKEVKAVLTPEQQKKWDTLKAAKIGQHKNYRKGAIKDREAHLKSELALSDDQFTKFQVAKTVMKEKVDSLKKTTGSADDNKAALKKIREDYKTTMKSILSADQYQKWTSGNG